jgi:hypothetical protein
MKTLVPSVILNQTPRTLGARADGVLGVCAVELWEDRVGTVGEELSSGLEDDMLVTALL